MNTSIQILSTIYYCALSLAGLYAIFKFKAADNATKIICIFICNGLITELVAWQFAKIYHNNLTIYAISCIVELVLVSLYFNFSIDLFKKRNIGIYVAFLGIVLGILNILYFQPLGAFNSNFLFMECLFILFMSLFSLFRIVIVDDYNLKIQGNIHFWIPCIFVFYQCGTLVGWNAYQYFSMQSKYQAAMLHICALSINIGTYLAFTFLFYHFLKPKPRNMNLNETKISV